MRGYFINKFKYFANQQYETQRTLIKIIDSKPELERFFSAFSVSSVAKENSLIEL
jgi:hypothetical protein